MNKSAFDSEAFGDAAVAKIIGLSIIFNLSSILKPSPDLQNLPNAHQSLPHPPIMTTTTVAHLDFDDLLTMRPPFPPSASTTAPYHPAALAIGSLYFPTSAADTALQCPPPPVAQQVDHPTNALIPDFPQFDLFAIPPLPPVTAPDNSSQQMQQMQYFGANSTVSTLTPSFVPHAPALPAPPQWPAAANGCGGGSGSGSGSSTGSIGSIETATNSTVTTATTSTRKRKSVTNGGIDKDKLEERRRKNRLSSSKCYYNRKRQIEQVERTLTSEKRRAIQLYARELDLRNENARLKKQLVLRNIRIPSSFLTTTRTDAFVRPPPVTHGV